MLFLAGSILLSAWLNIVFKLCAKLNIDTFQTIVFNYGFCVLTGIVLTSSSGTAIPPASVIWAFVLGLGFILTFNLTAMTVRLNGVATATVATKVSLIIPFILSLYIYKDGLNAFKLIGIIITILAVIFTLLPEKQAGVSVELKRILLPLSIFFGCGLLDATIKYTEHHYLTEETADVFLMHCFLIAFIAGVVLLAIGLFTGRIRFDYRALISGLILGVPNYFSIWCLIRFLKLHPENSSVWIPVNNVGIVLVNVLIGIGLFKEKLSFLNKVGIGLALLGIALLSYSI